jgi:23S rRNA pseudouridine1911/1915/1917 synthase
MLSVVPNENVTLSVVFQDDDLIILNKPAGLVTQPGKGHEDDTLLNGLFARFGKQLQRLGAPRDFGLLHRLDRETSGLLVVALSSKAYDGVRAQFEDRSIRKFYYAITDKAPNQPSGLINRPIAETEGRKLGEKRLAKITSAGKAAATAFRVVATSDIAALIECRPLTGKLHQVRVHLSSIGCHICGDGLYAPPRTAALSPRLALHSHRLAFVHPLTGQTLDMRTLFPRDLRSTLKRLKLPLPLKGEGSGAPPKEEPSAD